MTSVEPPLTLRARLMRRAILLSGMWSRPLLLGVRGIVLDADGRVFLVRHTYVGGWHLPGGGVEIGETLQGALARELAEEGNIHVAEVPQLHGVFFNAKLGRRDHVAVYVVRRYSVKGPRAPDYEIAECGFFPTVSLPEATTTSVRNRLDEVLTGTPIPTDW